MSTNNEDKLILGGHEFTSRFILGSGKFSLDLVKACIEKADAQIITLALRRANEGGLANILDYIPKNVTLLPNTSGARNAEEAVRIARLSREIGCGDFVKIEVIHDSKYLLPDNYDYVTGKFDKLLAEHGYVREGHYYRVEKPNEDTLVFFCHFGLECVLLAHLIGASPMVLWHGFCAAPSSVTTVNTEERREGIASFRISAFGDISHLYVHDEPPAFAARFCEMYSNTDERHD